MKKIIAAMISLVILASQFSGGNDAAEIDERAFVFVMTLDAEDEGKIRLGVQIAAGTESLNESSAGMNGGREGDGSGSGADKVRTYDAHAPVEPSHLKQGAYYLISATGQDYDQALMLLFATIPRKIDFSQVRQVIISERLARSDAFESLLESLLATKTMRNMAYVMIAKDSAVDFAAHQQSFLGSRLSEYIELRMRYAMRYGSVGSTTLTELWEDMVSGTLDTLATYVAVNDFSTTKALTPDRALDELPGHLPRASINQSEYLGAAIFDDRKMVGVLTGFNTGITRLLHGSVDLLFYSTHDAVFRLKQQKKPRLHVNRTGNKVTLEADIWVSAWETGLRSTIPVDLLEAALAKDCREQIQSFQAMRCDPMGFGERIIRFFPTIKEWEAADWRAIFHDAEIDVRVHVAANNTL